MIFPNTINKTTTMISAIAAINGIIFFFIIEKVFKFLSFYGEMHCILKTNFYQIVKCNDMYGEMDYIYRNNCSILTLKIIVKVLLRIYYSWT